MKRNLLTILFLILFSTLFTQGQGLYMPPLRYTSTGTTVFNIPSNCYGGSGVWLYINDQPTPTNQSWCIYGICKFAYPYGTLKVGDKVYFKDGCGNKSNTVTVDEDYVYVEVPNGSSYTGNGITNIDETPPYSKLASPIVVGKCSPININSHALHTFSILIGSDINNNTYSTGTLKYNGVPLTPSMVNIDKLGNSSKNVTISNGIITYNGSSTIYLNERLSGRVPATIEYSHNGILPSDIQELALGPLAVRIWNNGRITVKEAQYNGSSIETDQYADYTHSVFKITFDMGYFKLFVDGTEVKSIRRTVIYSTSSGILSNTFEP